MIISSILKKWLIPAGVSLLIVAFGASNWFSYNQGKDNVRQAQELQTAKTLLRVAREAEAIREHDLKLVMEARDRETTIVERIRNVPVNVPTPECTTLGDDWLQQYNNVIEAINSREYVN